jgi:glutamate synthase (NADPH/NADH)
MNAREGVMKNDEFGDELKKLYPIVEKNLSDSGSVDNVVEFLVQCSDRSLPEAMVTLVPEAWQHDELMSDLKKAFYKWSSFSMEYLQIFIMKIKFNYLIFVYLNLFRPWDGPALLTFTGRNF